jgi:hypothetical protein
MAGDERAAMVEQHYVSMFGMVRTPPLRRLPDEDVVLYVSDLPIPICSGAVGPHFAAAVESRRTFEVLDTLFANGQPFQWWSGPLSHSEKVEAIVSENGLVTEGPTPGMHADLALVSLAEAPPDIVVEQCTSRAERLEANRVFTQAFDLPDEFAEVFVDIFEGVQGVVQLAARIDGVIVGCAAGVALDGVMGVYNVGTLETARRRGVGQSVTAELMRIGRSLGCHSSILHSSELGYSVYQALGYEHVTDVYQYVWLPQH